MREREIENLTETSLKDPGKRKKRRIPDIQGLFFHVEPGKFQELIDRVKQAAKRKRRERK